jgi:hypothetical protein
MQLLDFSIDMKLIISINLFKKVIYQNYNYNYQKRMAYNIFFPLKNEPKE